jgi:signal transduction histidine kinase
MQLERTPPRGIRDALAQALGDPTLELFFWLPERGQYADADGHRATIPSGDSDRAVTPLASEGEPLAALVHDPSLAEEPELMDAACAAARFAVENARLHADLQAQLEKVKESRARLVSVADEERRRIERDLHDGIQQRLISIALALRHAKAGPTFKQSCCGSERPSAGRPTSFARFRVESTPRSSRTEASGRH